MFIYYSGDAPEDDVRAPIPQKHETLVENRPVHGTIPILPDNNVAKLMGLFCYRFSTTEKKIQTFGV